jgi:hypothetical protein
MVFAIKVSIDKVKSTRTLISLYPENDNAGVVFLQVIVSVVSDLGPHFLNVAVEQSILLPLDDIFEFVAIPKGPITYNIPSPCCRDHE